MLETVKYHRKLREVLAKLSVYFDVTEIRGSDLASFVFARKMNRAVEIYQSESSVIAEFWIDEIQQIEIEVNSYREAINLVIDWIRK